MDLDLRRQQVHQGWVASVVFFFYRSSREFTKLPTRDLIDLNRIIHVHLCQINVWKEKLKNKMQFLKLYTISPFDQSTRGNTSSRGGQGKPLENLRWR